MRGRPPAGPAWITELLYRTLAIVGQLLGDAGVPYTANGGTLLGAVRDGALVPWDVDGDIAVRHEDLETILAQRDLLRARGLDLFRKDNDIVKLFPVEGRLTGAGWRYPAVDIWPMASVEGRWAPSDLATRLYWVAEWFEADAFSTAIRRPFGAGEISSVRDEIAERYLTRTYGPNWGTEYVAYSGGLGDPFHRRRVAVRPSLPRPRQADGLELHEIDDGLLVYQQDPPRVHHLNHTATLVFALCTGEATIDEIVRHVERGYGLQDPPVAEVNACIEQLCSERVLVVG